MTIYRVIQGTALALEVVLVNQEGQVQAYVDDTPLSAEVWSGGSTALRFSVDTAWSDAPSGRLTVHVGSDQTAALEPGRYQGAVYVSDPNLGRITGFRWSFDCLSTALPLGSTEPAGPLYCAFDDVVAGRPWIKEFQDDDEAGGFSRYIRDASRWFDSIVQSRGSSRFGRSYLSGLLEAGALEVLPFVRQAVAYQVAALVSESRIGASKDSSDFAVLAARYRSHAVAAAIGGTALVRVGTNGHLRIHLGSVGV